MLPVICAVEGATDEPVARRLLEEVELLAGPFVRRTGGKSRIDPNLPRWNESAARLPWLVIRDLDHDDSECCVPELRSRLLGDTAGQVGMCFRLAVRAVEAWLLSDRGAFSDYFHVTGTLPREPDRLHDPKGELIRLCRRSRSRDVREGVPPRAGSGRRYGPEYVAIVGAFARDRWSPAEARTSSPSLDRAIIALERLRVWVNLDKTEG